MDPDASNTVTVIAAGFIKLLDAACMAALAMASAVARVNVDVDRIMMTNNNWRWCLHRSTTTTRVPTHSL